MKLIYIANARIPTEKAHGVQIMKTCEALGKEKVDLELWLPKRKQSGALANTNAFEFYGCKEVFRIKKISTIDLLEMTDRIGGKLDILAYCVQELSFVLAILFQNYNHRTVYTRSLMVAAAIKLFRRGRVFCEVHDFPRKKIMQFFFCWLLERFDGVVVVSAGLKNVLNLNNKTPVAVIVNAADTEKYQHIDKNKARKHLSLRNEDKIVVFTGTITQGRGVFTLLNAAMLLKNTNIKFILVGRLDVNYEEKLEKFKRSLKNVQLVGYVTPTEIPFYQVAADILVLPTGQETISWDKKWD